MIGSLLPKYCACSPKINDATPLLPNYIATPLWLILKTKTTIFLPKVEALQSSSNMLAPHHRLQCFKAAFYIPYCMLHQICTKWMIVQHLPLLCWWESSWFHYDNYIHCYIPQKHADIVTWAHNECCTPYIRMQTLLTALVISSTRKTKRND